MIMLLLRKLAIKLLVQFEEKTEFGRLIELSLMAEFDEKTNLQVICNNPVT